MSSNLVYCVSCGNPLMPKDAYKIFVDEIVELPWSTPQHRNYKGGNTKYVCSKECYEVFKMNMKEFWHPNGEY